MDRGAWQATVHGVTKSQTWLSNFHFHFHVLLYDRSLLVIYFPWWLSWWRNHLQCRRWRFDPWIRKIPGRRKLQPTPVFLPGKFHGQRSLVGYSPQDHRVGHWACTFSAKFPGCVTLYFNGSYPQLCFHKMTFPSIVDWTLTVAGSNNFYIWL